MDAEEEEESVASKRFGNSEDVRRKLAEIRINVIEDRKTREQEWKLENQKKKRSGGTGKKGADQQLYHANKRD